MPVNADTAAAVNSSGSDPITSSSHAEPPAEAGGSLWPRKFSILQCGARDTAHDRLDRLVDAALSAATANSGSTADPNGRSPITPVTVARVEPKSPPRTDIRRSPVISTNVPGGGALSSRAAGATTVADSTHPVGPPTRVAGTWSSG
jgi:hypothetical protein